jgi:hypothetical protein
VTCSAVTFNWTASELFACAIAGMPGPERISTECILLGCIPIVSSRWVGASRVDFPGIRRVDHHNASDIEAALAHVAAHYEEELHSAGNRQFFQYALSMWGRVHHTADVVFGSSYLHFVLVARTLNEEYTVLFQLLTLLYLFPLCAVDIYVSDVLWFMRHHYAAVEVLQQAGYVRADPLDPTEWQEWVRDPLQSTSYVRFKYVHVLDAVIDVADFSEDGAAVPITPDEDLRNTDGAAAAVLTLRPKWAAITIVLPVGRTFGDPHALLDRLRALPASSVHTLFKSLHLEGEVAGGESSFEAIAVSVGPEANMQDFTAAVRSVRVRRTVSLNRKEVGEAVVHSREVVNVCSLLDSVDPALNQNTAPIVAGVRNTAAWLSQRSVAQALEYSCIS